MNKLLSLLLVFTALNASAQAPGDTIKVKTFHYNSKTRDTTAHFPKQNLSYEKIIMKYNMRCKNALISNGTNRDQGCGEWDYSCNTYIVDSSKIEEVPSTSPNYKISNFTGTQFNYRINPIYDLYDYSLKNVTLNNTNSESKYTIGNGNVAMMELINPTNKSGKSQLLYSAAELVAMGFTAGDINGIELNVNNTGGKAQFFKIKIKQSNLKKLNANNPDLNGYTEVFNHHFQFVNGSNKILFHTPFVWDGSSNLIFELSFTNTVADNSVELIGSTDTVVSSIYANNNFALDLSSNGHVNINTSVLNSISNEMTVSFWAYGDAASMPTNTSVIYGYSNNSGQRQLNIHLPWSDNNIYFDCGYSSGNFDRINKASVASEQGGQWNHWTFTKNATTGSMKIYLNGTLWTSGTGKTKPISLLNLILGKGQDLNNNYKGKINELAIWNKEISAAEIANWVKKPLSNSHPNYNNLLAYYFMFEGFGQNITDNKNNLISNGNNINWTYDRGDKLSKAFYELSAKPNLTLLRGNYDLTVTNTTSRDSIKRNPNVVEKYSIISKSGVQPFANDVIKLDTTYYYYESSPVKIYNGDNGNVKSTVALSSDGSINISNLNYIRRFPYYNEIISFVTPYGIGLDLGPKGKSWFYDVTDFAPILKGDKRIQMTLGGQNQEQMDVEFYFIVGTPVRNVIDFNQIYNGASRVGGVSIGNINNESAFKQVKVKLPSNAVDFKIKSTITGHGAEGEFEVNGGQVDHQLNINGGNTEFSWVVTQECSFNPVFPQGGTWVYDRQGWCPGEVSLTKEHNITNLVNPGDSVTIDYNTSAPQKSGDYRYLVAHQLISYGSPNFNLDAAIIDVLSPTNNVLYSRSNPMCANPKIKVKNTGKTAITSIKFEYYVNGSNNIQDYTWTGNLASLESIDITLPTYHLFSRDLQSKNNSFNAVIKKVNNADDEYNLNNKIFSTFDVPEVVPGNFIFELKTNNYPAENSFKLYDADGKIIDQQSFTEVNKLYSFTYNLSGCYKLVVEDQGQDGLNWWANSAQGTGLARIKRANGSLLKTFQADFGGGFEYQFTTNNALATDNLNFENSIDIYPNPSQGKIIIESQNLNGATIEIVDVLGKLHYINNSVNDTQIEINENDLTAGVYFVVVKKGEWSKTEKIIVY